VCVMQQARVQQGIHACVHSRLCQQGPAGQPMVSGSQYTSDSTPTCYLGCATFSGCVDLDVQEKPGSLLVINQSSEVSSRVPQPVV
jgi:hypothetical protein